MGRHGSAFVANRLRRFVEFRTKFRPVVKHEQRLGVGDRYEDGHGLAVPLNDGALALDEGGVDEVAQARPRFLDSDGHGLPTFSHVASVQT